ncbi:MAG: sigma-70 family RNA polymerase sigma factor [Bacteroidales bacterium]|nr:sigma-70 family RNA polymerase sigma factor [Candidatus Sodaliphilus aphodohippi]
MNSYSDRSDDQLISLYVNGDNEAFDALLERHKDFVYGYIFHVVKNEDVANDIFQETFVKVITSLTSGRYTENGKFSAWVTRIAHNRIIDYYRQVKNEALQSTDATELNILNRKEYSEATIEDSMVSTQIHEDVRKLICHLPSLQREVVIMRYYKDMSFKEISETTKVSINTALGRMRYALINLRRLADEHQISLSI